jgi:hypothetical protein
MDPRKNWYYEAMKNKAKVKARNYNPGTNSASTITYESPDFANLEYRIQQLIRRKREARDRNAIFMDELNQIVELNRQHGAHNRQSRMNRGTQIAQQIRQNDELIVRLQNEVDEINDDFDDVSSVPRR